MFRILDKLSSNKKLGIICMMLVLSLLPIISIAAPPQVYKADSWVGSSGKEDIYGKEDEKGTKLDEKEDEEDKSIFESVKSIMNDMIVSLFSTICNSFYNLQKKLGMTIGSITMGRLDGGGIDIGGKRVALYTYELADGNFYGIASMATYSLVRSIIYIILVCVVIARFVSALYISSTSRAMSSLKESVQNFFLGFFLLALMPNIVDLLIYVRDLILYVLSSTMSKQLGTETLDITGIFVKIAADNGTILNFVLVGLSYALVFYYAFSYTSLALSMCIHVVAFPFTCITMQFDRQVLKNWFTTFLGYLAVPLVDFVLLMIPGVIMLVKNVSSVEVSFGVGVVQLIICLSIISARKAFKQALGINGMQGELSGVAMMIGAGRLASTVASLGATAMATSTAGAVSAAENQAMGQFYGGMSNIENAASSVTGSNGGGKGRKSKVGESYESAFDLNNKNVPNGSGIRDMDTKQEKGSMSGTMSKSGISINTPSAAAGERDTDTEKITPIQDSTTSEVGSTTPNVPDVMMSTGNDTMKGNNANEIYDSSDDNESEEDALARKKKLLLESFANTSNFEEPMFRNISNARKAELYKERAKQIRQDTRNKVIRQLAGGGAGAVAGFAMGMYYGPGVASMTASAGMRLGSKANDLADFANAHMNPQTAPQYTVSSHNKKKTDGNTPTPPTPPSLPPQSPTDPGTDLDNTPQNNVPSISGTSVQGTNAASEKDFMKYKKDFLSANTGIILDATESEFGKNGLSAKADDVFSNAYAEYSENYELFRANSAKRFEKNIGNSITQNMQSGGNDEYDKSCINDIVGKYSKEVINPTDENGKLKDVPADHILSRESLATRGYTFPN